MAKAKALEAAINPDPKWATHALMLRIFIEALNGRVVLSGPLRNVPKFDPTDPSSWTDWAIAVNHLIMLDENAELTDTALVGAVGILGAAHQVAAAVELPALTQEQIDHVIDSLEVINERIKQDQRFDAALTLSKAIVDELKKG